MSSYWQPPKSLAQPEDIANEPEIDKALRWLRWLRAFRHFIKSKRYRVMCVELDGEKLMIIRVSTAKLPPNADLTSSMEG